MQNIVDTVSNAAGINKLPHKQLGKNGPSVPRIGYGTMGLSAFYGPTKQDSERLALLDKLYADGELFWDTADIYGDSEDLIGRWFKQNPGKRQDIFLATKFANKVDADGKRSMDSSPEYAKAACAKSLARLGIDQIDLYFVHRLDGKTPIEKTVQALKELKDEGKIKYLGLSECSSESLRRAYKVHPIQAVQIEYSPFSLDIENPKIDLLNTCRELGVAIVAYSPIGRGMLSGAIRSRNDFEAGDFRLGAPRFSEENFSKNLELVDTISAIASKKGVTPTQLTLAWILAQGDDFFPIPGTTNSARVAENLGATKITLSSEENKEIRAACEKAETHGSRYPDFMAMSLFADTPPL